MTPTPETVAVDLGGSWIRIAAAAGGRIVFEKTQPAVSPNKLGFELRSLWRKRGWTKADRLIVGSKGVWTLAERRRLSLTFVGLARRVTVLSDAELALRAGAGGLRPALLLAAGTGSIAVGLGRNGRLVRAGGIGPGRGDEGSGWWIGKEYLRSGNNSRKQATAETAGWAARVIAKASRDPRCARIVSEAQGHLARLALDASSRLGRPPVALLGAGSLLENALFRRGVTKILKGPAPKRFLFLPPVRGPARSAALRPDLLPQRPPSFVPPRRGAKK